MHKLLWCVLCVDVLCVMCGNPLNLRYLLYTNDILVSITSESNSSMIRCDLWGHETRNAVLHTVPRQ
jgi:hypothetical protein